MIQRLTLGSVQQCVWSGKEIWSDEKQKSFKPAWKLCVFSKGIIFQKWTYVTNTAGYITLIGFEFPSKATDLHQPSKRTAVSAVSGVCCTSVEWQQILSIFCMFLCYMYLIPKLRNNNFNSHVALRPKTPACIIVLRDSGLLPDHGVSCRHSPWWTLWCRLKLTLQDCSILKYQWNISLHWTNCEASLDF